MNGIRYVQRYGVPWDAMPKDLPPGSTCYDYRGLLRGGGQMAEVNHNLVMIDWEKAGREASPMLAIVDAQSVKCVASQGERGYDAAKKVVGRKRHVAVDTDGRLLAVTVTAANVQDQDGGSLLVQRLVRLCSRIGTGMAEGGYKNRFIEAVRAGLSRIVEVVKRSDFVEGFVLLPKRWKVEQSIRTFTISRRLKIDYYTLIHVSAATMLFSSLTRIVASVTIQ